MVPPDETGIRTRALGAIRRRVAVDARALAAFRIGLGAILLVDLARRSFDLVAFSTDAGVVPRSVIATQSPTFGSLSVHALSGSAWAQAVLFVVAGLFALALLVGYRTRLAAVVSFLLLISLHVRNPAILNGGDSLLRHLLLWGVFVPLGRRWSVDAVRADAVRTGAVRAEEAADGGNSVASVATAGLLLQVVLVYATNATLKLRGDAWPGGWAVEQVMALTRFSTWLGEALLSVPVVLRFGTFLWLGLLVCSPLLVVLTGRWRSLLAGAIALVHLGMAALMDLGLFPFVSVAGLLPFFGPSVWDRLPAPPERVFRRLDALAPAGPDLPGRVARRRIGAVLGVALPAVLLCAIVVINAVSVGYVELPEGAPEALEDKSWSMFAPEPPADDGWYVLPATLESGRQVDALRDGPVSWDRPPDVDGTYPNNRWQVLLYRLQDGEETHLQRPLAEYHCWRWNRAHEDEMTHVRIAYVEHSVREQDRGEPLTLGRFDCPGSTGDAG